MKQLIIIFLILLSTSVNALINGKKQIDDFPSVQLHFKNGSHICSGTFIDPHTILTAAHCIVEPKKKWSTFSIDLEFIFDSFGKKVPFKLIKLIPHPKFKNSLIHSTHDIGVIKLSKNSRYSTFPVLTNTIESSGEVLLYGCGRTGILSKNKECLTGQNTIFNFLGYLAMWGNSSTSSEVGIDVSIAPNDSGGALVEKKTNSIVGVHWGTTSNKFFRKLNIPILSFSTSLTNPENYSFVIESLENN